MEPQNSYISGEEYEKRDLYRGRILLYSAVLIILFSIFKYDSFSTWKFLAVYLPLFCAILFFKFRRWGLLTPLGFLIWFGFMYMSVGTIYNHDSLVITGPLVCPKGYEPKVRTLVQNPVPGETYTSSQLYCEDEEGTIRRPVREPHLVLLALYLLAALPAFFILTLLFKFFSTKMNQPYTILIAGSLLYFFYVIYIWSNRDFILETVKKIF